MTIDQSSAPMPSMDEGKKRKKDKAPKEAKAPKVKAERAPRSGGRTYTYGAEVRLLDLSENFPSRQELEQDAAAELTAAIAPSLEMLRDAAPNAASPEDAYRQIESKLDPGPPRDMDAELPQHPIYSGDALVYQQLRRHYGSPHAGGSFWRSWFPGR